MNEQSTRRIQLGDLPPVNIFGQNDANLRIIRDQFGARVVARGSEIFLEGDAQEVAALEKIFDHLCSVAGQGRYVSPSDVRYAVRMVLDQNGHALESLNGDDGPRPFHGLRKEIKPKTVTQKDYLRAMEKRDIVFAIGPAGTGKTYLAMAAALSALNRREIERIHLVRPAVEAGESLGFLPGDFTEKVGPYLRPLYDALHDMMAADRVQKLLDNGTIEVAPLAYMRGRTLNNSIVILDEAQNTTLAADEDVPDSPREQLEGDHHGRRHADRSRAPRGLVDCSRSATCSAPWRGSRSSASATKTWCGTISSQEIIQAFDEYDGRNDRKGMAKGPLPSKGGETQ